MKNEMNIVNLSQFQSIELEIKYKDQEGKSQSVRISKISSRFTFMLKGNQKVLLAIAELYEKCKIENEIDGEIKTSLDMIKFNYELCNFMADNFDFLISILTGILKLYIGSWVNIKWTDENTSDDAKAALVTALLQSSFPTNQNDAFVKNKAKTTRSKKKV